MRKLRFILWAVLCLGIGLSGCKSPVDGEDPLAQTGDISGKALFSSAGDHRGITVILEKTDGLRSAAVLSFQRTGRAAAGAAGLDGISLVWKGSLATAPEAPRTNWAYYNSGEGRSYIYDGSAWQIIAQDGAAGATGAAGLDGISLVWKGSSATAPADPQLNWAYYNTNDRKSYIYDGSEWKTLAQDGATGATGAAGLDGISLVWKGSSATAPADPQLNWAYYNTIDRKSYIYDGSAWKIIAQDGEKGDKGDKGNDGAGAVPGSVTINAPAMVHHILVASYTPVDIPYVYLYCYRDGTYFNRDTWYPGTSTLTPTFTYTPVSTDVGSKISVRVYAVGYTGYVEASVTVAAFSPTASPLTVGSGAVSNTWQTGTIAAYGTNWYSFTAASGSAYSVQWDESGTGSGNGYTGYIYVAAYRADGTELFSNIDSGYATPQTITGYDGTVYLRVTPYSSSLAGTYAVRVYQ